MSYLTALDRDGAAIDADKSIWFQEYGYLHRDGRILRMLWYCGRLLEGFA